MTDTRSRPLPYSPADERPQPGEEQTRRTIDQTLRSIQQTTLADYGHPVRPVHAKSHAIVQGELTVTADLPPELAQGMFARAGTSPVVMRVSTNPGDVLDDSVSAPRGLALKIIGVDGERLPGHDAATQDWVLVNGPAFSAPDSAAFAKNLKLLAATTDTGQEWKKAFSAALRGAETAVEAVGGESPTLITLGGQASTHPLGESYYTQTPFRYGDHVAKLSLAPASAELKALTDQPVATRGRPNALREAAIDFFRSQDAEWELRVQLRTNPDTMPIEDASVVWPEDESPYRSVGRVIVRPQPAWSEERARQVDDGLSFSPWHGLAAHEPLGSVNRARRGCMTTRPPFARGTPAARWPNPRTAWTCRTRPRAPTVPRRDARAAGPAPRMLARATGPNR